MRWPNHYGRCKLACLSALLFVFALPTLGLDPGKTLTQYAHRIWGQEEGLVQPTIYSIAQTHDGFLWLGTQDSLIRFDGAHFREFDQAAAAGLQRSLIRALFEDPHGNLWVASVGSGVVRIARNRAFKRFTTREGMPSDDAFCLASDARGGVWICTDRGLVRLDANDRMQVFTTAAGLPTNQVHSVCEAPDGTLWASGLDFGLVRKRGARFEPYSGPRIGAALASALACGKDGSVWAGTSYGAFRIDGSSVLPLTMKEGLPDNEVSSLIEGPDSSIWIGTNDGISRYSKGEISVYRTRDGLSHSLVLSLFIDREGTLWAGTKDGLDQFADPKVTPYTTNEGMSSNDAGPVLEDRRGRLWIGTLGHGLNLFDGHRFQALTTHNGLLNDTVLSLQLDPTGDLWVGSEGGLNRLRDGKVVAAYTRKDGLSASSVRALAVDAKGVLWAGTNGGLDRMEGSRFVKVPLPSMGGVLALSAGRTVRLFASTDAPGFSYLTNGPPGTYSLAVAHAVDCYYLDPDRHEAWLGTLGSGLLRWRNGSVAHLRVKDGLFDNRIYSILRDDHANFWLASSKGIFRVSEKDLRDFADGKIHYVTSIPFSTGQLRFECRSGVQPAACRTHDGRFWFSTTNGLVVVDPNHLSGNSIPPPVEITSMVINGQRVEPKQGVHLSPFERNLEVRYAGLSFVSPEKVTFRYILDGYDKTWTDAGNRREAFFTNLPPGNFHFHVMARNADGVWSKEDAALDFTVDPRLYQRRWFFPLLALLLGAVITVWVRLRIRRLKRQFDLVLGERSRIARELHDTLLQGLAGITMQLQALWTKLPSSKEKSFLGEIIQDAAKCSTEARQSLWGLRSIGPTASLDFSGKLAKLARHAAEKNPVQLVLHLDPVSLRSSPEVEYQLLRVAQEAISNSLRHASAAKMEIRLLSTPQQVELLVIDDGAGFDSGKPYFGHFGMVGMRERASEIGAELAVSSKPGNGTIVRIVLPLSRRPEVDSKPQEAFQHLTR